MLLPASTGYSPRGGVNPAKPATILRYNTTAVSYRFTVNKTPVVYYSGLHTMRKPEYKHWTTVFTSYNDATRLLYETTNKHLTSYIDARSGQYTVFTWYPDILDNNERFIEAVQNCGMKI